MLSKEERKAIAERIGKEFDFTENDEVYEALIGEEIPDSTIWETDCAVVRDRLIELCDTSNMVELPVDKDGKIIRVGDTVYNKNMDKCRVTGIEYMAINSVCIHCFATSTLDSITYLPNQLTHMSVSETEQLAKAIKNAVDTFNEQLRDFAEFMASVCGNND